MTRLERMAREIVTRAPSWGARWALGYLEAALVADGRSITWERGRRLNRRATIGARLVRLREDARLRKLLPHDASFKSMQDELAMLEREFAELRAFELRERASR